MRRLFLGTILILALPALSPVSVRHNLANGSAASIAFAGHTNIGEYCEYPSPGCICDTECGYAPTQAKTHHGTARLKVPSSIGGLLSVGFTLLLVWARIRTLV
jgi:hypothetical protein